MSDRPAASVWNPRDAFAESLRVPDERIDLARAALLIAAEEYPALDVARYLARLDELAGEVAPRLAEARSAAERVAVLNRFLFAEQGFAGNREHYEDPRNSFLNEVLDRCAGIPITLSLVYMEVARRAGVEVDGVGFPGHFLVKHGQRGPDRGRCLLRDRAHARGMSGPARRGAGRRGAAASPSCTCARPRRARSWCACSAT